jgi:ribonuclease E
LIDAPQHEVMNTALVINVDQAQSEIIALTLSNLLNVLKKHLLLKLLRTSSSTSCGSGRDGNC